jgi:hypothetical protein
VSDIENLGLAEDQSVDVPEASRPVPWQQFLRRWQGPIAFGPFAVFIFVTLKFFGNSPANWLFITLIFATIIWAVAIAGYALYLKYVE